VSERPLLARIKQFFRPLKAHAEAKAARLAPRMAAVVRDPETGATPFRSAMAQTLLRQGPSHKERAAKHLVKGD
jgi:hypothetical protein